MNDVSSQPKIVQALYNFQPANTDEICFHKGDLITVTQVIDGGWWEGTLRGITGWFPSNYVQEIQPVIGETRAGARSPTGKLTDMKQLVRHDTANTATTVTDNHLVVLQELIGSEKKFVSVMEELLQSYLAPLEANDGLLTADEYSSLCSNLVDIVSVHKDLLNSLEDTFRLPVSQQRFGGLFLELAAKIQSLYYKYSANHPCAVAVLQNKRDELSKYMEEMGAASPGVMTLTTYLSKPFQQIERYSSLLKELERHSEEAHVDRGDTQRAIAVYRDIALTCTELRKLKEIEYDILHADVQGWEGEEMSSLGDVVMLSHVRVQTTSDVDAANAERLERLLMLFRGVLLVLSVTSRVSGYIYKGRMTINNATVNNADDVDKTAFHISGGLGIEELTVICTSVQEKSKWLSALKSHVKAMNASAIVKPQHLQVIRRRSHESPGQSVAVNSSTFTRAAPITAKWNMSCLRPCPPLRPSTFLKDDGTRSPRAGRRLLGYGRRKLVDDAKILEDDAFILRVIEAYCTSTKARQAVNSSLLESPQVLIAEEEKIIIEEMKGDQTIVEEKTLVDTVYSLKDQVRELRQEQQRLRRDVDNEKRARKRLETLVRHSLKSVVENAADIHDTSTGNANP